MGEIEKSTKSVHTVYISGKVSGIEDKATLLFAEAEQDLIDKGFKVVNPTTLAHDHDLSWENYMRADIRALMGCDGVYLLRNWADSRGAKIERRIATELGMEIYYQ